MDLKAQQDGFETGVPTYNKEKSTLESTSGKSLNELNLNHAQRLVLISNNSDNPEVHPETKTEDIPFDTKREFDPDLKPGEERVVQKVNQQKNSLKNLSIKLLSMVQIKNIQVIQINQVSLSNQLIMRTTNLVIINLVIQAVIKNNYLITGSNDTNNGTLIGSLFVFSRRKNKQNNEK